MESGPYQTTKPLDFQFCPPTVPLRGEGLDPGPSRRLSWGHVHAISWAPGGPGAIFGRRTVKRGAAAARWGLAALIGLLLLLAYWFRLDRYLTLENLQRYHAGLVALYHHRPLATLAGYFLLYVAVTALSIPGAVVMTLAGAAIFGLWVGTVVVSFASTAGATLAFAAARFLLRDWVRERFGRQLRPIYEGIEREGAFYLFTLRLVPIFPFFLVNILMALTPIRLRTFYWVSQVGMLPGTIAYVNAGTQLASIRSISDILSLRVLVSFALLGLLPLASKKGIQWYRGRRGGVGG